MTETMVSKDIDAEKPIFSFSRFRTYLTCPAQYDYIYNKKAERTTDIVLVIGSTLHLMAEEYCKAKIDGKVADREILMDVARKYWEEHTTPFNLTDVDKLFKFQQVVELYDSYEPLLQKTKPKKVEEHLLLYPEGREWGIQGYVDRVDEDDSLCDIKTASKSPYKNKTTGKYTMSKMHPEQLITYAWMYREIYGTPVKRAYVDYVVKTKQPQAIRVDLEFSDPDINSVINMYDRLYDAISKGVYPPNRSSNFCSATQCPFWVDCTGLPS